MPLTQDISRCLADRLGAAGASEAAFAEGLEATRPALDELRRRHDDGSLPLLRLPERRDDLEACARAAEKLQRGASDILVFGTGGSSLGAQALAQLAGHRIPGLRPAQGPSVHFLDNLDGASLEAMFRALDLKSARFLVVSKSGTTPETLLQMIAAIEALKGAGLDWNLANHMVALTEPGPPEKNPVRAMAAHFGLDVLDHDPSIGGRYSVLSNVGLLPALLFGLDVAALRAGAAAILQPILDGAAPEECLPAVGAAVHTALAKARPIHAVVLMPYSDRLRLLSNWFVQLWAESLGKDGKGATPVAAAGPVDQHSQLQLFLDGPNDKVLTLIQTASAGTGPRMPQALARDPSLGYLAGRAVGDLTDCQSRATAETLARNGRAVRLLGLDAVNETGLGALLMHFMLETILVGRLMGVDPFDQPAVEQSKRLTREYLKTM